MARQQERYIKLHDGCYCTQLKVNPSNWNEKGASVQEDWYIWYRFYDPTIEDKKGKIKPKLVPLQGMNMFKTLAERREATKTLLDEELIILQEEGYNPITKSYMIEREDDQFEGDITPDTPFIEALKKTNELLAIDKATRKGIRSIIKGVELAATQLRYNTFPICKISRKHIRRILDRCGKNSSRWSDARFNAYRGHLMMLYSELVEQEAVPGNPIRDISKRTVTKKLPVVLTDEERIQVNNHLQQVFPRFHMFVHLFFHSGGRKTELFQLKPTMINLQTQKYRCIIKKRKTYTEVERTIKDIAIPYWEYFLQGCPDDHYIFGPKFLPGKKAMGEGMPTRYWQQYVKDLPDPQKEKSQKHKANNRHRSYGLGINVDFYKLKHLNTSEVVDALDEQAAAALNAQTSTAMVIGIYDVKQKDRQHERLKKVNNSFA